jgi:hypothetical protein
MPGMKKPMRKMRGGMGTKKKAMRGGGAMKKPVMAKRGKAMAKGFKIISPRKQKK